jgi:hypothetical protein
MNLPVVRKKYDPALSGILFQTIIVMQACGPQKIWSSGTDRIDALENPKNERDKP